MNTSGNRVPYEFDQRQYKMMLDYINAYESGQIGMNLLITNLEALLNFLKETSKDWEEKFYKQWTVLDEFYAFVCYENRKCFNKDESKIVNEALRQMKILISKQIRNDDS